MLLTTAQAANDYLEAGLDPPLQIHSLICVLFRVGAFHLPLISVLRKLGEAGGGGRIRALFLDAFHIQPTSVNRFRDIETIDC